MLGVRCRRCGPRCWLPALGLAARQPFATKAITSGGYHRALMLEQRIQQHFIDSADLKYQAAQVLSQPIAAAVHAILACVTSGGKVLACGNGPSAAEAQQFAAFCVAGFERDRPELAAMALTADSTLLTASPAGWTCLPSSLPGRCGPWARRAMCCWRCRCRATTPTCWPPQRPPMSAT
jgi:threonine dehydrogenase-like Zn-dependent dehydrogenase